LAGALLFDKKSAKVLHYFSFGLQDVGILQIFYSQAVLQRTIVDSPPFLEPGLAEKIEVSAHTTRLPIKEVGGLDGFLYEPAQNFEVFSNIQH
jgi:hypothetical protein